MVTDAPQVIVRPAARDFSDWESVLKLILDAFAYMGPRIDPPSSALRLTPKSVQAHAEGGALLLAHRGSDVVGCLFLHQKNDALYIGKLAISPAHQRTGIGRKLVDAARDEARLRGIGMLELETRIELTENHAAFARMGFIKTAETSHEGFDRPTSIVMRAPV